MEETIRYLIRYLIRSEVPEEIYKSIGYTSEEEKFGLYKVVIVASPFFSDGTYGKTSSLPTLPLPELEGVPVLFGEPRIEQRGDTWIIYADLVAGAYFLMTRYEEMVRPEVHDEHGRFPGKESLPYRAGFIKRPVVDLYGLILRKILRKAGFPIEKVDQHFHNFYLTHDVDVPFKYRTWRSVLRALIKNRNLKEAWDVKTGKLSWDPYYKFPEMFYKFEYFKARVPFPCHCIMFFRSGGHTKHDRPHYSFKSKDMRTLLKFCEEMGVEMGLHASYEAGGDPSLIAKERERLCDILGKEIRWNRHHFLRSRRPEDMEALISAGITEDFTMGYADIAGFRLGTSREVRWINPHTRQLTPLVLHPLLIMDCTLSERKYMHLKFSEALLYSIELLHETISVGGEPTLLWHNTSLESDWCSDYNYIGWLYNVLVKEMVEFEAFDDYLNLE